MLHSLPAHSACTVHAVGDGCPHSAPGHGFFVHVAAACCSFCCSCQAHQHVTGRFTAPRMGMHMKKRSVAAHRRPCTVARSHGALTLYPSKPLNSIDQTTKEATVQTQLVQPLPCGRPPLVVHFLGQH